MQNNSKNLYQSKKRHLNLQSCQQFQTLQYITTKKIKRDISNQNKQKIDFFKQNYFDSKKSVVKNESQATQTINKFGKKDIQYKEYNKTSYRDIFEYQLQIEQIPQLKNIIFVQSKLDEYLFFSKNNRNKKMGQSFNQIKKRLWVSSHAYLTKIILRRILYLATNFYQIISIFDYDSFLIRLPSNHQDLKKRKKLFMEHIFQFVESQKNKFTSQQLQNVKLSYQIPLHPLNINQKSSQLIQEMSEQKKKLFQQKQTNKLNSLQIFNNNHKEFEDKLYSLIKQKQQKFHKQSQNRKNKNYLCKEQVLSVFDQIFQIFTVKKVNNLFTASLIQNLDKKTNSLLSNIHLILKEIQQKTPQFLKSLNHSKGQIIQINKKVYKQARLKLFEVQNKQNEQKNTDKSQKIQVSIQLQSK